MATLTQEQIQERRYAFKAELETNHLDLGMLSGEWSDYDFPDGFIFADSHACPCMAFHHYHSTKDGKLLQVG